MKGLQKILLALLFTAFSVSSAWAQETDSTSLARLRIEIRKLEAAGRDAPFELREVNDRYLKSRREHLKALLRQRLDTMKRYAANVRPMLNAQEGKDLDSAIEELSLELNGDEAAPWENNASSTNPSAGAAQGSEVGSSYVAESGKREGDEPQERRQREPRPARMPQGNEASPSIEIKIPSESGQTVSSSPVNLQVQVNDAAQQIKELYVLVLDEAKKKVDEQTVKVDYNNKGLQKLKVRLVKKTNDILVTPYVKEGGDFKALADLQQLRTVVCEGEDCGAAVAEEEPSALSGRNTRFIIGFEQAGAASAESVQKPFLDFFINTPLPFGGQDVLWPRLSLWGDIRLAASAQQITTFGTAAASPVAAFAGGKLNELVTGFDFSAGPEVLLTRAGRTHISLIGGFGAISPLTYKQYAPIYKVPGASNPQREQFLIDFPGVAGKDFIAFVPPDRDRFLRHYFGGFRFRTYQYEKGADYKTDEPRDTFPAMLDVTFGQDEAVTGGRLHKFVVNLDGFLPLPWPKASSLLYLFGTAKFIAGGRKTIKTPYILDTAESSIQLTNDKVFITNQTSNRDYYRIGFGVDLIELFKFAKKSGEQSAKEK